ncbi:hypothetical protein ACTHR6_01185 [Ralstonia holmesii]|uniref:hypothetical protein n=1 Tax=Ralstonia TaxID=48736 RepID=UPI000469D50F|nr:hypothetical protein [Ralstonia pickettii]
MNCSLFDLITAAASLAATIGNDPSITGRDKLAAQVLAEDLRALRTLAFRFNDYVPLVTQA